MSHHVSTGKPELYYADGQWSADNPLIVGPRDHAFWMSSVVFDGARAFDGLAPDLDRHCARLVASARELGLGAPLSADEITDICLEGIRQLPRERVYYVRPAFYATDGLLIPDPASTKFVLSILDIPWPGWDGFTAGKSSYRRPNVDMAPTAAKAACLYPNVARAIREAQARGFANAVMLDGDGHVAEFATANLWIVSGGVVRTPVPTGVFLNGITRQRVMALLRADGIAVEEASLRFEDVLAADEVFNTGNLGKVMPCIGVEDRVFEPGPVYARARELYFDFAKTATI